MNVEGELKSNLENFEAPEAAPKNNLAEDMESLRKELRTLVLCPPSGSAAPVPLTNPKEVSPEEAQPKEFEEFADFMDDAPLGIALLDREGAIVKTNRLFPYMLDYSAEEICARRLEDFALEPALFTTPVQQIFDGVYPVAKAEGVWRRKNGETLWVQLTATATGNYQQPRCLLVIEDIGARKAVEQNLHTEKKLLEWIINSSIDGIVAFDADGFFTLWNPAMERIFGVSAKETVGRQIFLACPFFKAIGEDVNFNAALKGKTVLSKDICYTIPGTTRMVWFEGYYGPVANPAGGEIIGGLAVIRDVTDRRQAEEARRTSDERYRELFEHAGDMIYACNLDGEITSVNKTMERILGYEQREMLGMNLMQLVAPEHRPGARRLLDRQITDETPLLRELELQTKDGGCITMETSNRLIFREGRPCGIQGIGRDISARKQDETTLRTTNEKLRQEVQELEQRYNKMARLGEMGDILRACLTADEVYDVIVRFARELFPGQSGALFVIDQTRNIVETVAEWGDNSKIDSVFTPDECWALRRGKMHAVDDTRVGLVCRHLKTPYPPGYICVPMMAQGNAVGMMHLACADASQMTEAKQRLVLAMAERIAMALSNFRLHEILRNQSIRDQLTGLFNRSFMEEAVELELRRAARTQSPMSFIMLSIDRFRDLLKEYDGDVSESILRKIGVLLQSNIRKGDIACRFNEHTFIVILPQTLREIGFQRAERFCKLARVLEVMDRNGRTGNISVSVGAAMFPEHGQTVEALLHSAEIAVEQANQDGGNRVVAAS